MTVKCDPKVFDFVTQFDLMVSDLDINGFRR